MSDTPKIDHHLDASHLLCPLPVLKARKHLISLPAGAVLKLTATDPAAWIDVPHFCAQAGHEMLSAQQCEGYAQFVIRRAAVLKVDGG